MLSQESILKRLTIVKYLYQLGMSQSELPETMSFTSILSFQDAIEIFLKLVAESKNLNTDNHYSFMKFWDDIPSLTLRESIRNLNTRRVNLKHKGILPAKQDIEISRVNVMDFFDQNVRSQFGLDFKSISLVDLVTFPSVKQYLCEAEKAFENHQSELSIEKSASAFAELLEEYEKDKLGFLRESPFFFGKRLGRWSSGRDFLRKWDESTAKEFDAIVRSVTQLQESVKITSLGLDYRRYAKFKILTPVATKVGEKYMCELFGEERKWTMSNVRFCIDFVIESSLKLQEFNFDMDSLIKEEEEYTLEYENGDFETGIKFKDVFKSNTRNDSEDSGDPNSLK